MFELFQGVIKRADPQGFAIADQATTLNMLKIFLGNIDQAEVNAESPGYLGQGVGIELLDQLHHLLAFARIITFAQADIAGT